MSLAESHLSDANLAYANLADANLSKANLAAANLPMAIVTRANLTEALLSYTSFPNVNLSQVHGLESVVHQSPSSIGVDTLTLTLRGSGGRFTDEQVIFFENAGVPATLLEYLPSIMEANPLQFYSCFISYSHEDKPFAQKVYESLRERNIPCWLDEKQLLPGDDIY